MKKINLLIYEQPNILKSLQKATIKSIQRRWNEAFSRGSEHKLLCRHDEVARAVRLEFGIALLEKGDELLHHTSDVVAVDEREAQLHRPPKRNRIRI